MLSCKDGIENRITLYIICDESMPPFVLLHRDDSFSIFLILSLANYHPISPPHQSCYSWCHSPAYIPPNWGQVDGTFIQSTMLKMRSIDGVDEFEIVVVCISFVYCGEAQPNQQIMWDGGCLVQIMWDKDGTQLLQPPFISWVNRFERCFMVEMKIQTSFFGNCSQVRLKKHKNDEIWLL